jgi:hypothetical protein
MDKPEKINERFEAWWAKNGDKHGDNKEIERRAFIAGWQAKAEDVALFTKRNPTLSTDK